MEQEIRNLIAKHYKKAVVKDIDADIDGAVSLNVSGVNFRYLAKRILDKFPEIYWVYFAGKTTYLFSREILKWEGFKMKEHHGKN